MLRVQHACAERRPAGCVGRSFWQAEVEFEPAYTALQALLTLQSGEALKARSPSPWQFGEDRAQQRFAQAVAGPGIRAATSGPRSNSSSRRCRTPGSTGLVR